MFSQEHLDKMHEGIDLFNRQLYWECHEALEHIWLEDRGDPHRYVYWAVIQVAAAMVHYQKNNLIGANTMIKKAQEKFKKCHELGVVSDYLEKQLKWSLLESLSFEIPDNSSKIEVFKKLFDFRF